LDRFKIEEDVMHPVNYLFDEIMRHYWGFPQKPERPARKDRDVPAWRLPRWRRENDAR
jgi:hypothetical protein